MDQSAAIADAKTKRSSGPSKDSKAAAGSALSQSGRSFRQTKDGVMIYKPGSGATNFSAREVREAIRDTRGGKLTRDKK